MTFAVCMCACFLIHFLSCSFRYDLCAMDLLDVLYMFIRKTVKLLPNFASSHFGWCLFVDDYFAGLNTTSQMDTNFCQHSWIMAFIWNSGFRLKPQNIRMKCACVVCIKFPVETCVWISISGSILCVFFVVAVESNKLLIPVTCLNMNKLPRSGYFQSCHVQCKIHAHSAPAHSENIYANKYNNRWRVGEKEKDVNFY